MSIGTNIRDMRKSKKISQRKLGELLGVSQAMIAQYENGTRIPKIETIQKIALALKVDVSALRDFSDYKQSIIEESPILSTLQRKGHNIDSDDLAQDLLQAKLIENLDITEDKQELLYAYNKLNKTGKKEAQKRILELTEIPRYVEEYVEYSVQTIAKSMQDGHIRIIKKEENKD